MTWWRSRESSAQQTDRAVFDLPMKEVLEASRPGKGTTCFDRVRQLEARLNELIVGQQDTIRLMLASAIAQQPFLMIGPPGVAKTLLASRFFELIGLRRPTNEARQAALPSYFEYLLHSFSIPEELYGPLNIEELKRARVVRVNDNMLTGKGVKACFLDEIFKANSAILNTLLTLINERRYFNDSVFQRSDLRIIIGASNETPTVKGEALGAGGGTSSGILSELAAFYDRWTIRSYVDVVEPDDLKPANETVFAEIRTAALKQHASRFHTVEPAPLEPAACINDLILLGRSIVAPSGNKGDISRVSQPSPGFVQALLDLALSLKRDEQHQQCTINPRKILFVELVARAHALLSHGPDRPPDVEHLAVFRHIWDDEYKADALARTVNHRINYGGPLVRPASN